MKHLSLLSRMIISNVWLLTDEAGRRYLVDTGHPLERLALQASLWRRGVRGKGDLTAVLLTHRHSDHAGNAAWLRKTFDAPIACHQADADVLTGRMKRSNLARGVAHLYEELLCHIEDRFPAETAVDELYEDGSWKWGLRMMHVPGHTEGSVLLHHEATQTLFTGDAILTGLAPLRALEVMRLAVPGFSLDVDQCHAAVRAVLKSLPATQVVASGHGPAVTANAEAKLRRL